MRFCRSPTSGMREERVRDDKFNKGKEAAVAAAEMVAWRRRVS